MIYALTAEQGAFRDAVRDLLGRAARPRESFDGGPAIDVALWGRLAEIGVTGLLISEDLGGSGASPFEAVLLGEQVGAFAAPVPLVTVNIAAWLLASAPDHAAAHEHSKALAAGESIVLAAVSARSGLQSQLRASRSVSAHGTASWRVTGVIPDALEAGAATAVVALADTDDGQRAFVIDLAQPEITLEDLDCLDPTQRLASITCSSAAGIDLGEIPGSSLDNCMALAWTLLAAQALGAAATGLEITTRYVKDRHQFGQPIGRFQAVKHRVADMLIDVENARSAVYNAGWALSGAREDAHLAAHLAKAVGTENSVRVAESAIQAHGGIGFTWEYDLHLYLRRAKSCALALGQPDEHFAAIADGILPAARTGRLPEGAAQ
jgi:alkylation response protein AidB-like acyl-CoA dehydrogenase